MPTRLPNAVQNALADLVVDRLDAGSGAGTVKVYTGTQPADADDAATGTLLATITLADPAFGSASGGVATANDFDAVNAVANGTAGWCRAADSTGATVHDGNVTATGGGGVLELASTALVVGVVLDVTSYTWTQPAG